MDFKFPCKIVHCIITQFDMYHDAFIANEIIICMLYYKCVEIWLQLVAFCLFHMSVVSLVKLVISYYIITSKINRLYIIIIIYTVSFVRLFCYITSWSVSQQHCLHSITLCTEPQNEPIRFSVLVTLGYKMIGTTSCI